MSEHRCVLCEKRIEDKHDQTCRFGGKVYITQCDGYGKYQDAVADLIGEKPRIKPNYVDVGFRYPDYVAPYSSVDFDELVANPSAERMKKVQQIKQLAKELLNDEYGAKAKPVSADKVRFALEAVAHHLHTVGNRSGERAAFILSTVNDEAAILMLARILTS